MLKALLTLILLFSTLITGLANADVPAKLAINETQQVVFKLPEGWTKNTKKSPYDMQYIAADQRMNSAVFLYKKMDIAKDYTAESMLKFHLDDLRGKRKYFEFIEAEKTYPFKNGKITSTAFAGDKNNARNYYQIALVQLEQAPEIYLVIIQVSLPSAWQKNKPILDEILQSAELSKL